MDAWYYEIPTITRWYLTLSVLTTAACFFDFISPFSLYLNFRLIIEKYEVSQVALKICCVDAKCLHAKCAQCWRPRIWAVLENIYEFLLFRDAQLGFCLPHVFPVSLCRSQFGKIVASSRHLDRMNHALHAYHKTHSKQVDDRMVAGVYTAIGCEQLFI